jgi:hypothetical protein
MLNNGGVQGQIYAARALTNMAADPAVQDQIVSIGAVPHLVGIMRDNVGAAPAAAGKLLPPAHTRARAIIAKIPVFFIE